MSENEPFVIKGKKVERKLLESRPTQRCRISDCQAWCCTGGVWVDLREKEKILANAEKIKPFLPPTRRDESIWFDGVQEDGAEYPSGRGEGTTVVNDPTHPIGTTCIFLRPSDRYCALQAANTAHGEDPWDLKPFYCILYPLTVDEDLLQLDDANELYQEGGHCQRDCAEPVPLHITFQAELEYVLGQEGYAELARQGAGGNL